MGDPPETLHVEDRTWRVAPDRVDLLEPVLVRADDPGLGETVKENPARAVVRVPLADGTAAYLKRFRIRSHAERVKHLVRATKARAEWRTLRRLRDALENAPPGPVPLTVPEALAFAEERRAGLPRAAWLLVREVPNRGTLSAFLSSGEVDPVLRHRLLEGTGVLVRRMHDAGLWHRDLHFGNLLVLADGPGLGIIDLHKAWWMPAMPDRLRIRDLGELWGHSRSQLSRADGLRLLRAYDPTPGRAERLAPGAVRGGEAWVQRHLLSRGKRPWKRRTSEFRRHDLDGTRVRRRRVVELDEILDLARRGAEEGEVLKEDDRTRVVRVDRADGPPHAVVKRYARIGAAGRLADLVRRPPGRRAWGAAHAAWVRGILVARPFGLVEDRSGALGLERNLVEPHVEGPSLAEAYRRASPARRGAIARATGRLFRTLHERGIDHADLKAPNLVVARAPGDLDPEGRHLGGDGYPEGDPVVVPLDLDAARVRSPGPEDRVRNVGHLLASLHAADVPVRPVDAARFLAAYQEAGPGRILGRDRRAEREERRRRARAVLADARGHLVRWDREEAAPAWWDRAEALVADEPEGPPGSDREPDRPTSAAALAAAVLGAILVRTVLALRVSVVSPDGALFSRLARRAADGAWDGLLASAQHPLAALLAAPLVGPLGPETALIVVAILAGGLATLALHRLGCLLGGPRVGLAAAWVHALLPFLVRYGSEPTADGLHAALLAGAVAAGATALRHARTAPLLAATGSLSGLAYLARPEGAVALLAGLPALVEGARRGGLRRLGLLVVCLGLPALVIAGPYVGHLRAETGSWWPTRKKTPTQLLGTSSDGSDVARAERSDDGPLLPAPVRALPYAIRKLGRAATVPVLLLALLGIGVALAGHPRWARGRAGVAALGGPALALLGLGALLKGYVGYLSPRHLIGVAGLLAAPAALGLVAASDGLARAAGGGGVAGRRLGLAVLVLLGAGLAAEAVEDPYEGKDRAIRGAAALVRETAPADRPPLLVGAGWGAGPVAREAGVPWLETHVPPLRYLEDRGLPPGTTHLVLYARTHGEPLPPVASPPAGTRRIGTVTTGHRGRRYRMVVHLVDPAQRLDGAGRGE